MNELIEHIKELRRKLHNHPEPSGDEYYAKDLIEQELRALKPDTIYTHLDFNGVVAYWHSRAVDNAPTLAFRADTDALHYGHRCGHDGHTAILLLFAHLVAQNAARKVNVILIFQPEEETGRGAAKVMKSGLLQHYGVRYVFGLHNLPGYPLGQVVLNRGTFAAASVGVKYSLTGRSTHASTPELGVNPAVPVANIIKEFYALNRPPERENFCQTTLVGCHMGGEDYGVSAGNAELMFTLRAYTNVAMEKLMAKTDEIVEQERNYTLYASRTLSDQFHATENTPAVVDRLASIFSEHGVNYQINETPFRWSEDFAEYLMEFDGAFFGIGSGEQQPELHHPDYQFPDDLIEPAAHVFELIMNTFTI